MHCASHGNMQPCVPVPCTSNMFMLTRVLARVSIAVTCQAVTSTSDIEVCKPIF